MDENVDERHCGCHTLTAARIVGWVGIVFGVLTLLIAFFFGHTAGGYIDGFFTIITYISLILAYHTADRRAYLIFLVVNACLIVGKAIYLMILLVVIVLTPGGWRRYMYGGWGGGYPNNGFLGYGSGPSWRMAGSMSYGSSLINPYGYGPYGYGGGYTVDSMYFGAMLMIGLLVIGLILNVYFEYVGFRAYQIVSAQPRPLNSPTATTDAGSSYRDGRKTATPLPTLETYLPAYTQAVDEATRYRYTPTTV
ncbi:hypothetical protein DdX_16881 [Ditylenchus destructor]|uniref:Uncharacterized protein n=1 Tax=Ditylenchus destructor TaxID=166010 RepID=A0AAD4MQ20_9BILA|nr:hypothetical protein DdX_16881 [Ditylenchus destructor]